MSHPLLKPRSNLYLYFGLWLLIALLHALVLSVNQHLTLQAAVADSVVFNLVYSAFGVSFWYTCRYNSLQRELLWKTVPAHLLAALVAAFLWVTLSTAVLRALMDGNMAYLDFLNTSRWWRVPIGLLFYLVIIAFYYVYIYSVNLSEQSLREARLRTLITEAELKSLKFQINPHFLFNALNSINALTMTDPARAGEMTQKLGGYLRHTIAKNEKQRIPLREELESVRLYLEIEAVRFADKFTFVEDVPAGCLDLQVPSMLLQPLFENAIKHGVYESLEPVRINLTCAQQRDRLKLSVQNDFDPQAVRRKGEGIGLKNIQKRLEMMYGQRALMRFGPDGRIFKVDIELPAEVD